MSGMSLGMKLEDFLLNAEVMIGNALSDPEMKAGLSNFGYTEVKLAAGKQLFDEADALVKKQKVEYGEQIEATKLLDDVWEAADSAFMKTLKVARVAFQGNVKAYRALMLVEKRKGSLSGWLEQAGNFYDNILGDADLIQAMGNFNYTREKLAAERDNIAIVREKNIKQNKETGEAQDATKKRDAKLDELAGWLSDLKAIARVAFEEEPQKLEKLGILVLNAPRAKKKAAASSTSSASASA